MGDAISNYARHRGIVESTMFFEFLESKDNSLETVKGLGYLDTLLRNELHSSEQGIHDAAAHQRIDELRTTRASYGFIHQIIKQALVPAMIDDMVAALERAVRRRSPPEDEGRLAEELESLRRFTRAYQSSLDTNAHATLGSSYDFPAWIGAGYRSDLSSYRRDEPVTMTVRRAGGRLPNAKLDSIDASNCSQQQFTEWLYFIRNTRDYVSVSSLESAAA